MHALPTEINSVIDIYTEYVQGYVAEEKEISLAFIGYRGGRFMTYVHANHVHAFIYVLPRGGCRDCEIQPIFPDLLHRLRYRVILRLNR